MKAALAFLLPLLAAAAPAKRQVAVITDTSIVYETDVVATVTVWVDPSELPTPTSTPVVSHTSVASIASVASVAAASPSMVHPQPLPMPAPSSSSVVSMVSVASPAYTPPTTSSVAPVPTTSTTPDYVPPMSTTSSPAYVPPTTSSVAPTSTSAAPVSSGSGGASMLGAGPFTGDLTAYADTGAALACGGTFDESANIVAISHTTFDQFTPNGNPNNNPLCGTEITFTYEGTQHTATIQDRCTGCNPGDLDLPLDFWTAVTGQPYGRLSVEWVV